jgi:formylglycine-generating enzyme required for sulfatase activity
MVDIGGRFCVDRFEISLIDAVSGRSLSPHHHPSPALARRDHDEWLKRAAGTGPLAARAVGLPELPAWQLEPGVSPRAVSEPGRLPSAFLDLDAARSACANAGKRLCQRREWLMACRSERGTRHPYGDTLDSARCNLAAPAHPGVVLHGKSTLGERDPRMNLVEHRGRTLLRPAGTLLGCASPWEGDAVWDMVGNLDEWIDDPAGTFVGGFYARDTPWGCDARIEIHSADYYDYSLGARCCRD